MKSRKFIVYQPLYIIINLLMYFQKLKLITGARYELKSIAHMARF